MKHVVTATVLL